MVSPKCSSTSRSEVAHHCSIRNRSIRNTPGIWMALTPGASLILMDAIESFKRGKFAETARLVACFDQGSEYRHFAFLIGYRF